MPEVTREPDLQEVVSNPAPTPGGLPRPAEPSKAMMLLAHFGFRRVSALYVLVVVIVVFAIWIPSQFLQYDTLRQILNENAVPGFMALALIVPLAAGIFDLSIGFTMGVVSVLVSHLLGTTHLGPVVCIAIGVLAGITIGAGNAFVVVVLKIDSFIGTLATGSLLQALILIVSGDTEQTSGITPGFTGIAQNKVAGFTLPVIYLIVVAFVMWYWLEHRAVGRRAHAIGLAPEAARLAGIRVDAIRFASLVVSGLVAGVAGILVTASVGGGSPDIGPPYLIPAFAAAFLGATQLKGGLFNVWGTVLAIVLLGTTYTGLALAGVPTWTPYVVTGAVLIAALGLAGLKRRTPSDAAAGSGAATGAS